MGLFSKIRDILTYEDEVEEEPIKKEVTTVSIPSPEPSEEYKRNYDFDITEKEEYVEPEEIIIPVKPTPKEKPAFTIFTDSDFNLPPKKEVKEKKEERKPYTPREEVKRFRPTPIISPVYGLIREEKEEVKTSVSQFSKPREEITLDKLRQKAYGTPSLEDELESSLFTTKELSFEASNKNDIFDEVNSVLDERDSKEKVNLDSDEAINENDLFNLIDSMYERNND